MVENKIIEILMKGAHDELTKREIVILTKFKAESAENSRFVEENRLILDNLSVDVAQDSTIFNVESALQTVNSKKDHVASFRQLNAPTPAKKTSYNWMSLAAAALVLVGLTTLFFTFGGVRSDSIVYSTTDQSEVFTLEDGSEITLNKQSTLTLKAGFGEKLREMSLEGEAFFRVKNIDNQPFIVQAGELQVEVIGTAFNVDCRSNRESIDVYVAEGKVKVTNRVSNGKVVLTAGQVAILHNQTRILSRKTLGNQNQTSWITDKLSFNNVTLEQAIEEIESHFDIDIKLSNRALSDCKYTSLFNDPDPEEVLETLSVVFDVQIVKEGKSSYELMGGKCN